MNLKAVLKEISEQLFAYLCKKIKKFIKKSSVRNETETSHMDSGGLGAIVKSYVEECGGTFTVETDVDLFKAVIYFVK